MPRSLLWCLAGLLLGAGSVSGLWLLQQQIPPDLPVESPEPIAQGDGLQPLLSPNPHAAERCAELLGIRERDTPADPTNFGVRRPTDSSGGPVPDQPSLVVVHETVLSLEDTLNFFQTPHPRDADQASYHLLLARNGTAYRLVPDLNRAFGAGWSAWGDATIRHHSATTPLAGGSLNNVALHISLESPEDGRGDDDAHGGYSKSQYMRLAEHVLIWQLRWGIPMRRITTHESVDRSHSRRDPRSFRWERFDRAWDVAAKRCGISIDGPYGIDAMPPTTASVEQDR